MNESGKWLAVWLMITIPAFVWMLNDNYTTQKVTDCRVRCVYAVDVYPTISPELHNECLKECGPRK